MAKYNKKRKYNNNNKYNNYKNYKNGSNSLMTRAWKTIKEANNTNSTLDFAFKINYVFTARYDPAYKTGTAAINVYEVLLKSENFRNMMRNYDQVKINGVTCRINVTDVATSLANSGNNFVQAINVVTGWDKTGLSVVPIGSGDDYVGDVRFFDTTAPETPSIDNAIEGSDFDGATAAASYINTIGTRVTEGYGAKKGLLNSYQRFSRYESCWPSTMDEKCCYVPTANFNEYTTGINSNTGLCQISGDYSEMNVNTQLSIPNPCLPFENPSIKWKPTLLVGVFRSTVSGEGVVDKYGESPTVIFNAEFTIPVTFKGQKGDS